MNHYYILYKITTLPAGGQFIKYAKKLNFNKVIYTRKKSEAYAVGFLPAITYSLLHGLKTIECNLNNNEDSKTGRTSLFIKKDYNKN